MENKELENRGVSTGSLQSPTVGSSGAGVDASRIARKAIKGVLSAGAKDPDFAYKQSMSDFESQIASARSQKGMYGLSALRSVGDLRDTIFQNERERKEKEASSGFEGGVQGIRKQKSFNSSLRENESSIERGLNNQLRSQNLAISQMTDQELQLLRSTNAESKEIADEIARRQLGGVSETKLYDFKSDQNVWGHMAAMFGKEQTWSPDLDHEGLKKDPFFQQVFKELGLDINDPTLRNKVGKALQGTIKKSIKPKWLPFLGTEGNVKDSVITGNWLHKDVESESYNIGGRKSYSKASFRKNEEELAGKKSKDKKAVAKKPLTGQDWFNKITRGKPWNSRG